MKCKFEIKVAPARPKEFVGLGAILSVNPNSGKGRLGRLWVHQNEGVRLNPDAQIEFDMKNLVGQNVYVDLVLRFNATIVPGSNVGRASDCRVATQSEIEVMNKAIMNKPKQQPRYIQGEIAYLNPKSHQATVEVMWKGHKHSCVIDLFGSKKLDPTKIYVGFKIKGKPVMEGQIMKLVDVLPLSKLVKNAPAHDELKLNREGSKLTDIRRNLARKTNNLTLRSKFQYYEKLRGLTLEESLYLEYKARNRVSKQAMVYRFTQDFLKYGCGFMNAEGGVYVAGVLDDTMEVCGFKCDAAMRDKIVCSFDEAVRRKFNKQFDYVADFVPVRGTGSSDLFVLRVCFAKENDQKGELYTVPWRVQVGDKQVTERRAFKKRQKSCTAMTTEEILSVGAKRGGDGDGLKKMEEYVKKILEAKGMDLPKKKQGGIHFKSKEQEDLYMYLRELFGNVYLDDKLFELCCEKDWNKMKVLEYHARTYRCCKHKGKLQA